MPAPRRFDLDADDPRHGTANGYNNLGCRCGACRAAWAKWKTEQNHRVGRHRPREVYIAERKAHADAAPHGTESKYKYGCRCAECRRAMTTARYKRLPNDPTERRAIWREYSRRSRARKRARVAA